MTKFHYWLRRICAVLAGFVLFLSGYLKVMDPAGAALIVREYLAFFHLGFLGWSSGIISVILAVLETLTGAAMIMAVHRKKTGILAMAMMAFFTVITIILLIFNPSMDCGCFGEAIHLTHLQSFLKNLVLDFLVATAFLPLSSLGSHKKRKVAVFWLIAAAVAGLSVYSHNHLPLRDFTPFRISSTLAASEDTGAQSVSFIYEKDGQERSFTLEELGSLTDTTWNFVRAEETGGGNDSPLLSFRDIQDNYRDTLAASGRVLAISVYAPEQLGRKKWERTEKLCRDAVENGFTPLVLTAASPETAAETIPGGILEQGIAYFADRKTLISLNRSNGGLTYFDDGILIKKWASRSLPDREELREAAEKDPVAVMIDADSYGRIWFQSAALILIALMILL